MPPVKVIPQALPTDKMTSRTSIISHLLFPPVFRPQQCWGSNSKGQLGQNDSNGRGNTAISMGDNLPSVDLGTTFSAATVASGNAFNCAISTEGFVKVRYYMEMRAGSDCLLYCKVRTSQLSFALYVW